VNWRLPMPSIVCNLLILHSDWFRLKSVHAYFSLIYSSRYLISNLTSYRSPSNQKECQDESVETLLERDSIGRASHWTYLFAMNPATNFLKHGCHPRKSSPPFASLLAIVCEGKLSLTLIRNKIEFRGSESTGDCRRDLHRQLERSSRHS
jgi:hypothetical protein